MLSFQYLISKSANVLKSQIVSTRLLSKEIFKEPEPLVLGAHDQNCCGQFFWGGGGGEVGEDWRRMK